MQMRNYALELENRLAFIRETLERSGKKGIVFGNSGGKDSALVGILCAKACGNTLGVMLPCGVGRSYAQDMRDAQALAQDVGFPCLTVDLQPVRQALLEQLPQGMTQPALQNIAARLRMTALYTIAQSRDALVAGTGNRSEAYVGYFTKWGDGAYDFNPIADLTVTEIYEFLRYLGAPEAFLTKPPSAALFDGQTDEQELGMAYEEIDAFLLYGRAQPEIRERLTHMHQQTAHKRAPAPRYGDLEGGMDA